MTKQIRKPPTDPHHRELVSFIIIIANKKNIYPEIEEKDEDHSLLKHEIRKTNQTPLIYIRKEKRTKGKGKKNKGKKECQRQGYYQNDKAEEQMRQVTENILSHARCVMY